MNIEHAQTIFQSASRAFSDLAATIAEQLTPAFAAFSRAARELWEVLYETAKAEYRVRFGRLPGSERTARLRKKRRTVVMDWFMRELKRLHKPAYPLSPVAYD